MSRRYVEVQSAVCKHDGRSLQLVDITHFVYNFIGNGRERAAQGGLQVTRMVRSPKRIGKREGQFNVVLEIVDVTLKRGRAVARERLWVRPEFAKVATHIEDQYAHASTLRASSLRTSDAPYKEAERLEWQAEQIVLTIARNAIEAFVSLEKQVIQAKKAAEQDALLAGDKTADDIVRLHDCITKSLLADGEEILRQLNEEH